MSDHMDDELLSLCAVKGNRKVICGTSAGVLDIFNWGWWGDMTDRMVGHPCSVDNIVHIDDLTVATSGDDGVIRCVARGRSACAHVRACRRVCVYDACLAACAEESLLISIRCRCPSLWFLGWFRSSPTR
jgi:hypothetical protein